MVFRTAPVNTDRRIGGVGVSSGCTGILGHEGGSSFAPYWIVGPTVPDRGGNRPKSEAALKEVVRVGHQG
jgi:hypothetical protein